MLFSTPDTIYTFMTSRTLTSISTRWGWIHFLPNVHIPDRFKDQLSDKRWNDHLEYLPAPGIKARADWYFLLLPEFFLVLHCSSYPSISMTSSAVVPSNDVLSWTNQDGRESILFNSWGILYRFQVQFFTLWHSQVAHRLLFFSDHYCIEWA